MQLHVGWDNVAGGMVATPILKPKNLVPGTDNGHAANRSDCF